MKDTQQARYESTQLKERGLTATHVFIAHDSKYTVEFDAVLAADGCEAKRVGRRGANLTA